MAKKPNTPCAGCGKLLWGGGKGSLPVGERKCRECRKAGPSTALHATPRACLVCQQSYYSPHSRALYCSLRCAAVAREASGTKQIAPRPCSVCTTPVQTTGTVPLCPPCSVQRTADRYRSKCRRRRALKRGAEAEKYTLDEVAERDQFRCGLCGWPVDMALRHPNPWSPTIDHIVPISLGGDDTRANVWLAHRLCNLRKGNRVQVPRTASL